ncbi:probable methyltransferase-like protein 15 homolog isoform X1 [Stegodyphus dumicola]|uniref:probable methyltransferase-like protein 15 homolog isoform X1 n=1 Tax=Stegodyphus dumicola TaxID=202533 RepID=UPI0015B2BE1E|nr:probable methyltransferase-like protein 15 homolog isoform X1 [Stegodyphus dumicola]
MILQKKFFGNIFRAFRKAVYSNLYFSSATANEANSQYEEEFGHTPVMPNEVLKALQPSDNQVFLDMTFGAGGHSRHLLNTAAIKLYCLDRDPIAYEKAVKLSKEYRSSVTPLLGRFSEVQDVLKEVGVLPNSIDGILIDAGCSSMQMDCPERGFSVSKNGPLDMRMDGSRYPDEPTAADVLSSLDVPSLVKIFKIYGEEKRSKKVAQALFDARYMLKSINTTYELADLIEGILDGEERFDKLRRASHSATKIFQGLRIFVNNELNELNYAMEMAHLFLKPGGRIAVITFHSLEDRVVKRHFLGIDMDEPVSQSLSQKYANAALWHAKAEIDELYSKRWTPLYKHVIKPSSEEVAANPRSRSAKLRAALKNS